MLTLLMDMVPELVAAVSALATLVALAVILSLMAVL